MFVEGRQNSGLLPDESQRQNVVLVDGYQPITVLGVRVGVGEVGGQYEATRPGEVPSAWSCVFREDGDAKRTEGLRQDD